MRKLVIIGTAVAILLVGCAGIGGYRLFKTFIVISRAKITKQQFDERRTGQAETDVRRALPTPLDSSIAENDTDRKDIPPQAQCIYYLTDLPNPRHGTTVFRFCFTDGKLTDKRTVTISQ